jgi:hypothetical protein
MTNWITFLIIAIILVTLDKGLTAINIMSVQKHNPGTDPYAVEKNPLARYSFQKLGLLGGSIVYWIFSVMTFMLAIYLMRYPASIIAPNNSYGVALYIIVILYFFVIGNNFYFFWRYNKLL